MISNYTQSLLFRKCLFLLAIFSFNFTFGYSNSPVTVEVLSSADLELTISSPNANPGIFGYVDLEISLTNNGPESTENVLLEFPFPSDLPIANNPTASQGLFSNWWTGVATWNVGSLPSGMTVTVDLSLFTLAEDIFFYGQVTNSDKVDDDSTPNNGTAPNPVEDDEAVIIINDTNIDPCELMTLISNLQCDDNGTPNDPSDDLFNFDMTVNGQNTSGSWIGSIPLTTGGTATIIGSIGVPIFLVFDIELINNTSGGVVSFEVADLNDPGCTDMVSVVAPPPCSNQQPCSIDNLSPTNIQCFDSGTPNDSTDDTWSFDLIVNGMNTSANWMATIAGQTYMGTYNTTTSLGLFDIANGDLQLVVTDANDPSCSATITITPPAPCSDGSTCSFGFEGWDSVCDDAGTPTDPSDDVWYAHINPQGTGLGTTFSLSGDIQAPNLLYGQTYIFGPYPIIPFFERNIQIVDESGNCSQIYILTPTATCSGSTQPDIELSMSSDDESGAFQIISFDLTVTNTGGFNANFLEIEIPQPVGTVLQGGNEFTATGGNVSGFNDLIWSFPILAPGQTETITVNYFTLTSDAIAGYAQVTGMSNMDEDSTPNNGTPPTVNEDDEAAFTVGNIVICGISGPLVSNITCDDNGTPLQADDLFSFDITVQGNGAAGFNLTTNAGPNGVFEYGEVIPVSDYPFSNLPVEILAVDVLDSNCFASINLLGSFTPCSSGTDCNIFYDVVDKVCDDNGTSDSADDTYVIELTASGQGVDAGTGWTVTVNNQTYSGLYGQVGIIGPFLITDGNFQMNIIDNENPDCSSVLLSLPPPPCSSGGGGDTDLKLELSSSPMFVGSELVTHNLVITNEGDENASGVSVQFYQGSSFAVTSSNASIGSYNLQTKIWTIGTIPVGESETLVLGEQFVDFSFATSASISFFEILTMDGIDPDSTPGNDGGDKTESEDDEVGFSVFPIGQSVPYDLSVALNSDATNVSLGDVFTIEFSITHSNYAVDGVEAEILIPSTLQIVSFNESQGSFNPLDGKWDAGYFFAAANTATLEITVTLLDDTQPTVVFGQILTTVNGTNLDFDSTPGNGVCCLPNEDDEAVLTIQPDGNVLKPELNAQSFSAFLIPDETILTTELIQQNSGTAIAGSHQTNVYFSEDTSISPDDYLLVNYMVGNLFGIGATEDIGPFGSDYVDGLPPGTYYVIFSIDHLNQIDELDETNNIEIVPITLGGMNNGPDLELEINSSSNFNQYDFVSFDITVTNTGTEPVNFLEIWLEDIEGGVFQGGNEGTATSGDFFPVGGGISPWVLTDNPLMPNESETLTINIFVLSPDFVRVYAEVIYQSETDADSTPDNGTPPIPNEDDEAVGILGSPLPLIQQITIGEKKVPQSTPILLETVDVFPNPADDLLTVILETELEQVVNFQIINLQGSIVFSFEKGAVKGTNLFEKDISHLEKGIYFLKMNTKQGLITQRFIKK